MIRVGQNHIYTPYMTVYLVISLPKIPYTHLIYMVLANPIHDACKPRALSYFFSIHTTATGASPEP